METHGRGCSRLGGIDRHGGFVVRSIVVIVLALSLCACSILDSFEFGGSSLDPNKIYLTPTESVTVAPRNTHRYACIDAPLLCVQHGIAFECRCP
jgi:hypothetical protein